jgi:hypothetical protein
MLAFFAATAQTALSPQPAWPLVLAIITAVGFGGIAIKAHRPPATFSAAGGLASFLIGLTASGLANACSVPNTPAVRTGLQLLALVSTVCFVALAALLYVFSHGWSHRRGHAHSDSQRI